MLQPTVFSEEVIRQQQIDDPVELIEEAVEQAQEGPGVPEDEELEGCLFEASTIHLEQTPQSRLQRGGEALLRQHVEDGGQRRMGVNLRVGSGGAGV